MSWLSSRGSRNARAGGGRRQQEAATPGGPELHRSLALASLLEAMGKQSKLQVLDLGPAVGGNVEFLARFGCKLYIEDLYGALAAHGPRPAGEPDRDLRGEPASRRSSGNGLPHSREWADSALADRLFAELLPFPPETRFDAVLAWDLFNYMERREVSALARHLTRFCRPGALLFALISILKQIPAQPIRFRILDSERLAYEPRTTASRPCPRYAPAELDNWLRGFRLDRSFLMRHGIQEYLFVREQD
ncbi:MAG TPA: class I SAM-dependent methyltransferase [Thermoanaerobaculia bacterium]|nr:class I SAM-dependent methyltransferase [Thermoanaerobaculia bacterium]